MSNAPGISVPVINTAELRIALPNTRVARSVEITLGGPHRHELRSSASARRTEPASSMRPDRHERNRLRKRIQARPRSICSSAAVARRAGRSSIGAITAHGVSELQQFDLRLGAELLENLLGIARGNIEDERQPTFRPHAAIA